MQIIVVAQGKIRLLIKQVNQEFIKIYGTTRRKRRTLPFCTGKITTFSLVFLNKKRKSNYFVE